MRIGVYGTLRDPDVQAAVLGTTGRPSYFGQLKVPDAQLYYVAGASYPAIAPLAGATAVLDIYEGLSAAMLAALVAYEGKGYQTIEWRQQELAFLVFLPTPELSLTSAVWTLQDWTRQHKADFLSALES